MYERESIGPNRTVADARTDTLDEFLADGGRAGGNSKRAASSEFLTTALTPARCSRSKSAPNTPCPTRGAALSGPLGGSSFRQPDLSLLVQRGAAVADLLPQGCLVMVAVSVRSQPWGPKDEQPRHLPGDRRVVRGRGVDLRLTEPRPFPIWPERKRQATEGCGRWMRLRWPNATSTVRKQNLEAKGYGGP